MKRQDRNVSFVYRYGCYSVTSHGGMEKLELNIQKGKDSVLHSQRSMHSVHVIPQVLV